MAEVIRYVDPDATGAADGTSWTDAYTSLSAWNDAEKTDLVTAGDWHHVYCRASSGTADTTNFKPVERAGDWITGPDNYVLIEAASTDRATQSGIDTSKYRLHVTDPDDPVAAIDTDINYLRIDGLQLMLSYATGNYDNIIRLVGFGAIDATNDIRITNCYLKGPGSGESTGIYGDGEASLNLTIENCILIDVAYGYRFGGGDSYLYHSIGYNISSIANTTDSVLVARNCAMFANADDWTTGATDVDHCASDDGDGTNAVSPSEASWSNEFADHAGGDFTLLEDGNLYKGGVAISGGPESDINGDAWRSPPSIGADEIAAKVYRLPHMTVGP